MKYGFTKTKYIAGNQGLSLSLYLWSWAIGIEANWDMYSWMKRHSVVVRILLGPVAWAWVGFWDNRKLKKQLHAK